MLWLKELKTLCRGHNDCNSIEIIRTFFEKELEKANQKKFRIENVINYISNRKVMIIHLIAMNEYFPKPRPLRKNVKVELDLSNYAKKQI